MTITAAFQGIEGAYSSVALAAYFDAVGTAHERLGTPTFQQVATSVISGKADTGILPVDNAIAGTVRDGYDLLAQYDLVPICEIDWRMSSSSSTIAIVIALIFAFLMARSIFGFQVRVVGLAPQAARYGGFSSSRTVWLVLLISGGLAGLAGILEAAGPFGQMVPGFPSNYGFSAIIVAFLGRLHPIGVLLAGIVLAITFVGGEIAQTTIALPNAAVGIFQAMMLFLLLAGDILVRYRIVRVVRAQRVDAGSKSA